MISADDDEVPVLTEDDIREALRRGAERAERTRKELERHHLRNYSRSMALRLD